MDVFDKHQLRVAKATLRLSNAGAKIVGGMTKEEARLVIKRLTGKYSEEEVSNDS